LEQLVQTVQTRDESKTYWGVSGLRLGHACQRKASALDALSELREIREEVRRLESRLDSLYALLEADDRREDSEQNDDRGQHSSGEAVDKIGLLPGMRTKSFAMIAGLARKHMDHEFTTDGFSLYEKRFFSILAKRYSFAEKVRREGRSLVYCFRPEALEAIGAREGVLKEVVGRSGAVRPGHLDEFLASLRQRYPHFCYWAANPEPCRFKLVFTDDSVARSVLGDLERRFGAHLVVRDVREREQDVREVG
jgi:hypothetical protein